MANLKPPELVFHGECPDCGERVIDLPDPLPQVGEDFDWGARDYDGFRIFMLEELAARFPERAAFKPADLEVVLVELLAAVLDQLSDMRDRVAAEAFLETARRPESVRRLLSFIAYDAVAHSPPGVIPAAGTDAEKVKALEAAWLADPHLMDAARRAGPGAIHTQHRMVTADDYGLRLEEHPLVARAHATVVWTGSWHTVQLAVMAEQNRRLDRHEDNIPISEDERAAGKEHHRTLDLWPATEDDADPVWDDLWPPAVPPTLRMLLHLYVDPYSMVGQEVILLDAVPIGISMSLSVRVAANYFRSEVRHAIGQALGTDPGGFFEPGRLRFGEDLHASDIYEALMQLDGIEHVCLNRFKKVGSQYANHADDGLIVLDGIEVARCDNVSGSPGLGYWRLVLHGGRRG